MVNKKISELFNNIADILEIKGDNRFRIRAYRQAAQTIDGLAEPIEEYYKDNPLETLPGIGKDLAGKIKEYIETGSVAHYEQLKKDVPGSVLELMHIPGVGPKMAHLMYAELGINNIDELKKAIEEKRFENIKGFAEKKLENILNGIAFLSKTDRRVLLSVASDIANEMTGCLRTRFPKARIEIAGSLRRGKDTIGDVDILASIKDTTVLMEHFIKHAAVKQVLAHGPTKSSILTRDGMQIDLRAVNSDDFGAAWAYLTGSKEHNVRLREIAIKKGLKLNEYGVFNIKTGKKLAGRNEKDVYKALGLSFICPEMRENRGEIELAFDDEIPELISGEDIKGDLHVHSTYSDGTLTLEQIARQCRALKYEYIIVTDHSKSLRVARGLSEDQVIEKNKAIDKLNKKAGRTLLLKGVEVDINRDGTLDYSDEVLAEFDFVIAAVHSGFKDSRSDITRRMVKAMRNPYVHMIAHPTGRLINRREGYDVDMKVLMEEALSTNTALEINANPERLDLTDVNCILAGRMGVKIGIGTDAHYDDQFHNMKYGVLTARRGWLKRDNVINTLGLKGLLRAIKK